MFEPFLELVEKHQRFLISGHENPDGDCVGTQVALYHFLEVMNKDVLILNSHRPEPSLDFLERHTPFQVHRPGEPLPEHEVHVLTDCSTLDRLGSVGQKARDLTGVVRVVVDHHVDGDQGDGDVLLWDVDACSSGTLIYDLYRKSGAPLSAAAAEGIFVTIVADSGWFRHSNTSDEAFAICADLVARGVRPHAVYNAIHRRKRPESVGLMAEGLRLAGFEADGRIAVLGLPLEIMGRVDRYDFNTDDLLEPLRSVEGVDVVLLLKEREDGSVKISLRSSDRIDVDGVARGFGGGGHRKAAGAEVAGSLDEVRSQVLDKLRVLIGG